MSHLIFSRILYYKTVKRITLVIQTFLNRCPTYESQFFNAPFNTTAEKNYELYFYETLWTMRTTFENYRGNAEAMDGTNVSPYRVVGKNKTKIWAWIGNTFSDKIHIE